MDVSLIICTRNRHQQLARCLESVRSIIFRNQWELMVADNGSTDRCGPMRPRRERRMAKHLLFRKQRYTDSQECIFIHKPKP
jgi:GT2 family glycosyltransferase